MGFVYAENSYILQKTCLVAERDPMAEAASCVSLAELLSAPHQHTHNSGLVGTLLAGQQNPLASQLKLSLPGKTTNHHYWLLGLLKALGRTILINGESSFRVRLTSSHVGLDMQITVLFTVCIRPLISCYDDVPVQLYFINTFSSQQ